MRHQLDPVQKTIKGRNFLSLNTYLDRVPGAPAAAAAAAAAATASTAKMMMDQRKRRAVEKFAAPNLSRQNSFKMPQQGRRSQHLHHPDPRFTRGRTYDEIAVCFCRWRIAGTTTSSAFSLSFRMSSILDNSVREDLNSLIRSNHEQVRTITSISTTRSTPTWWCSKSRTTCSSSNTETLEVSGTLTCLFSFSK